MKTESTMLISADLPPSEITKHMRIPIDWNKGIALTTHGEKTKGPPKVQSMNLMHLAPDPHSSKV